VLHERYPAQDEVRVLLEGVRREVSVSQLCRRDGIDRDRQRGVGFEPTTSIVMSMRPSAVRSHRACLAHGWRRGWGVSLQHMLPLGQVPESNSPCVQAKEGVRPGASQ
jgi:hypothetical protein